MTSLSLDFSPVFLKNPVSCRLFSKFLESEFNHENLLFWLAVEKYKHLNDLSKLPNAAKEIFDTYISDEAEYSVNIGFTVVQSLDLNLGRLVARLAELPSLSAEDPSPSLVLPLVSPLNNVSESFSNIPPLSSVPPLPPSLPSSSSSELEHNNSTLTSSTSSTASAATTSPTSSTLSLLSSSSNSVSSDESASEGVNQTEGANQTEGPQLSSSSNSDNDNNSDANNSDNTPKNKNEHANPHEEVYNQFLELFDEAQDHIFQLMKTDPYPRFLKSEFYAQLLAFRPSNDGINNEKHPLEEMVSEGFLQAAESQEGWEDNREQDGVIVSKKRFADIYTIRGIGIVDAEPLRLFNLINDLNKRKQWDDLFCEGYEIERLDESMIVYYMAWKSPSKLTPNRDFIVLRVARENKEDGSFMSVCKSVSYPNIPTRPGFVRADLESSGFIIRPCGPNQSLIDPKGKVPKAAESYVCQNRPLCILQLRKLVNEQKKLFDAAKDNWHIASPFSNANRKKLNRASVYVPNTRIFNTTGNSWNAAAVEEINPDRSSVEFSTDDLTGKLSQSPPKFNSTAPPPSSTFIQKSHTSPITKTTSNAFLITSKSSPTTGHQEYRFKLSPLSTNTPPDSTGISGTPPESSSNFFTKGKIKSRPESPSTPPDSPNTKVRLNIFETSRAKKIPLPLTPTPSPPTSSFVPPPSPPISVEASDDSSKVAAEEQPKKKGSKLNLFVAKMSSSPSTSDDEKPNSLWHRATKHFQPVTKQVDGQ